MTWLDRLAAHFGYTRTIPAPLPRINNGTDAVARGQRWQAFYEEEDGLRDMFASLRHDYFAKVGQLHPGETQKLLALGMADKIAVEIERKVQSVIETGKIRANDREHTARIAGISRP